MRVLIAPDSFGDGLTAVEAAGAIAAGWRRHAPGDELTLAPMSAGGAGFVATLHANLSGDLLGATIRGGVGGSLLPAAVLLVDGVAYVESAQAVGGRPTDADEAESATTYGVGELVGEAVEAGASKVVIGLAGGFAGDGGAGFLAALGAVSSPPDALVGGPRSLARLESVRLDDVLARVAGVSLVGARDLDIPLLGLLGTTNRTGANRGLAVDRLQHVDAQLERLADATDRRLAGTSGAGAGGGLGFAILLAGGSCQDGFTVVADAVGLSERARAADLVVTGEASFDFESRSGTVPGGVATIAGAAIRPCVALAERVLVGAREMRALGVESAYAMDDLVPDRATPAADRLSALAERVARTWSR